MPMKEAPPRSAFESESPWFRTTGWQPIRLAKHIELVLGEALFIRCRLLDSCKALVHPHIRNLSGERLCFARSPPTWCCLDAGLSGDFPHCLAAQTCKSDRLLP